MKFARTLLIQRDTVRGNVISADSPLLSLAPTGHNKRHHPTWFLKLKPSVSSLGSSLILSFFLCWHSVHQRSCHLPSWQSHSAIVRLNHHLSPSLCSLPWTLGRTPDQPPAYTHAFLPPAPSEQQNVVVNVNQTMSHPCFKPCGGFPLHLEKTQVPHPGL